MNEQLLSNLVKEDVKKRKTDKEALAKHADNLSYAIFKSLIYIPKPISKLFGGDRCPKCNNKLVYENIATGGFDMVGGLSHELYYTKCDCGYEYAKWRWE